MPAGVLVAKGKNRPSEDQAVDGAEPIADSPVVAEDDFSEPVKLPLWFKQGLERLAQAANQKRKRTDPLSKKLPLGWFIVNHMGDWLKQEEQALTAKKGEAP